MTSTKDERTRPLPADVPADRELSQSELESISGSGDGGGKKDPGDPSGPQKKPG